MDAELKRAATEVNLSQAQQELQDRGFDYLSASRQTTFLNRAVADFEDAYPWPWLEKTTSGPAPLTISDLKYVLRVFDSLGREYFGLDDANDEDLTETGTPSGWWIDDTSGGTVLTAWPVGAVTFSVRYIATSSTLANSTDTPSIPAAYHTTWIDLAVIQAYRDSDNFAAAGALQQVVDRDIARLIERYETRNRMNPRTVLIRAGSEDD